MRYSYSSGARRCGTDSVRGTKMPHGGHEPQNTFRTLVHHKKSIVLALSVCREQLRSEAGNTRVCMGYLLGICMALLKTCDYLRYCNGNSIQVLEPFILILNDYTYSVFIMLGLFLVMVGSPFIDGHSIYIAVRSSRRSWYAGIMLYILVQTVLYYGVIFCQRPCFPSEPPTYKMYGA